MPVHCSSTTSDQVLYLPTNVKVSINQDTVASRLDISWIQPTNNVYGYDTRVTSTTAATLYASYYRMEWSANKDFTNSSYYNVRMLAAGTENTPIFCATGSACSHTIGLEIQKVTINSGTGPLLSGTEPAFHLLYTGSLNQKVFVLTRAGSTSVTMFEQCTGHYEYLSILGQLYAVASPGPETILTTPFTGQFNDIIEAYCIKIPATIPRTSSQIAPQSPLSYGASAVQVENYLTQQFSALYPSFTNIFTVSREDAPLGLGYTWYITFKGELFFSNVALLAPIKVNNYNNQPFPALTTLTIERIATAGAIGVGYPTFVRVIAINNQGMGPGQLATVVNPLNSVGSITPRSPPGLPVNVSVWAVPTSDGSILRVTWSEGETYGDPITSYNIEGRTSGAALFTVLKTISVTDNSKYFETFVTVTAYQQYSIRVTAINSLSKSTSNYPTPSTPTTNGPKWFQKLASNIFQNSLTKPADYTSSSQTATPTCYVGLDQCTESDTINNYILARGLPGPPVITTPTFPRVDTNRPFGATWGLIYFSIPAINGNGVDKFRVEWTPDASFLTQPLFSAEVQQPTNYYNITGLTMGVTYYIRVTAHHTGGYGQPSSSYAFKPHQQPDAPYKPTLAFAVDSLDLVTYARSLNVTWNYPVIDPTDLVGDGGDSITDYIIEWSKEPFYYCFPTI